ncbi:MAG: hypothetical protein KIT09_35350 [Bryobacteraceae bacterium]|nr:hypothetical protein [Bryobacteraceae bacterium]
MSSIAARVRCLSAAIPRLLVHLALNVAALVWRTLLFRTTFIAITGSFGKTTAKDCLGAILSLEGPTVISPRSNNSREGLCETILRARPWHRFVVIEVAMGAVGEMISHAFLVRPDVAVVLSVGSAHTKNVPTLEQIAFEKSRLLRFLGRRGVAVLNVGDPRVAAMEAPLRCRVVRFGSSARCEVRGSQASSNWPLRLQLLVDTPAESKMIYTRLVGEHWASSVLGAIAAAHACGVGLVTAWRALQTVDPYSARLQPVALPSRAIMLRDETNGTLQSFEAALAVMRNATAARKVLVISDCSDFPKNDQKRQRYFARCAAEIFQSVVFVGERSHYGVKYALSAGMDPDNVHGFVTLQSVSEFLRRDLREGDLVLLRGRTTDHLSRVYHAQFGPIGCWRERCRRLGICDTCPELKAQSSAEPHVQDVDLLEFPPLWNGAPGGNGRPVEPEPEKVPALRDSGAPAARF